MNDAFRRKWEVRGVGWDVKRVSRGLVYVGLDALWGDMSHIPLCFMGNRILEI